MTLGNILHPTDAWLIMRSLRTLPIRIKQSSHTTQAVVAFLQNHPAVATIHYPFLPEHPQYDLAIKQMPIPMPLFSVEFKNTEMERLERMVEKLQFFLIAVSWGGHESLALPVSVDYHGQTKNLVRFYVGLEEADLLIEDLKQALSTLL
jgi:cystathionine beta-lyase/cystathionine gamma-synthase